MGFKANSNQTILGFYGDAQPTFAKMFINPSEHGLVSGFVTKVQTKLFSPAAVLVFFKETLSLF